MSKVQEYWELESKLEAIAFPRGRSVRELLNNHRAELSTEEALEVNRLVGLQAKLILIIHPHLRNVIPFPRRSANVY